MIIMSQYLLDIKSLLGMDLITESCCQKCKSKQNIMGVILN